MLGLKRKLSVQECHITAIFRATNSRQWLGYIIMITEILIDLCLPVNIIIPCHTGEIIFCQTNTGLTIHPILNFKS